ncbi:MAG: deoxyribonuclease IV [Candidatus Hydrothermae bacterium]|nr:deoxyribonuclease IV [Candidatus Hydrothermae bacterium]
MGLLGAHISIAGGIELAPERGYKLKCQSIQIFSKNQRQWISKELEPEKVESFRQNIIKFNIKKPVIHDSYLINLGSQKSEILEKSRDAFIDEALRAKVLGVPYLVFHPGANPNREEGISIIAESLNLTIDEVGEVTFLIEITAGQGNTIGRRFEEIRSIIDLVEKKERIGVCFDTAHAFESGYDIRDEESYFRSFDEFNRTIGIEKLMCFHLNDSKTALGSNVDRHEHIGKGHIGLKAFEFILNDQRFKEHPMLLETPGAEEFYEENLAVLRSLIKRK